MQYAKILGSGSYLPEKRVSNDDLAEFVDTSDEWIVSRTGIKFRHLAAENERTSDLAVIAAQRAVGRCGRGGGRNRPDCFGYGNPRYAVSVYGHHRAEQTRHCRLRGI